MTLHAVRPGEVRTSPGRAAGIPLLTTVPVTALALLCLFSVLAPAPLERWSVTVALVGLLIGVPHGAVDHLVAADRTGRSLRALVPLVVAYVGVAAVAAAALLLAPTVTFLVFLVVSALHFGTAQTEFDAERRGLGTPPPWRYPLHSAAHGAVVVGLLLWSDPLRVVPLLAQLAPGAARISSELRAPGLALVAVLIVLDAGWIALGAGHRSTPGRGLMLLELVVLVVAFVTAPPLAAFGVYFGAWHALRHSGRLLDTARTVADRDWWPAASRLARGGALPAGLALTTVIGSWLLPGPPVVGQVAVVLALTFPHAAVVWAADALSGLDPQR